MLGRALLFVIGVLSVPLASSGSALAWGDEGHKIVCEIAMRLAEPSTRAQIRKLIAMDDRYDFFSDSCTFPDHPRPEPKLHFINLPRNSSGLEDETCPSAARCALTGIKRDKGVLASISASEKAKLLALKNLGHWVGDIHQPLHVSFEDDRGGNKISVVGGCQSNLHSVWDTCVVQAAVGEDVDAATTELLKTITPAKIETWTHSDPWDWANESFTISERPETKYCLRHGDSCELSPGEVKIDAAYIQVNAPVIREQLQKAGVRLAHLLDSTLGK
jgi:hypothetical protein